jgi:hypothetical protein
MVKKSNLFIGSIITLLSLSILVLFVFTTINYYRLLKSASDVVEEELSSVSSSELAKRLDNLAFYLLVFLLLSFPLQLLSIFVVTKSK